MKSNTKKTVILTLIMAFVMALTTAIAVLVKNNVSNNDGSYSGPYDAARAQEDLEAMRAVGLIDEDGKMVSLDIREDGNSVELSTLAARISSGDDVGHLSVNGNAVSSEKILKLQQVDTLLDVITLVDTDVEITDEHVSSLKSLLEDIENGEVTLPDEVTRSVKSTSAGNNLLTTGEEEADPFPEGNLNRGAVEATDGKYTAPYISGSTYEANHTFTLTNPANTTWYAQGILRDNELSITGSDYDAKTKTITVTAQLIKKLNEPEPISFDWTAYSEVYTLTGDTSGTITWEKSDWMSKKTFTITLGGKEEHFVGSQSVIINVGNLKNAYFSAGNGTYETKTTWTKIYEFSANESNEVLDEYPAATIEIPSSEFTLYNTYVAKVDTYFYGMKTNQIPTTERFSIVAKGVENVYVASQKGFTSISSIVNEDLVQYGVTGRNDIAASGSVFRDSSFGNDTKRAATQEGGSWIVLRKSLWPLDPTATIRIPTIITKDEILNISVPAGTYYSGQVVPITVNLKEHAIATEGTTLTVNGVDCPMLNAANTESKIFTFAYRVKQVDSGSLHVTGMSNTLQNRDGGAITFDKEFPVSNFGIDEGVTLVSGEKLGGIDWDNVLYGIDDGAPGEQVVTIFLPFLPDASKNWIADEMEEIFPAISMPVPGNENATAVGYLTSGYFSTDVGKTRYPIYILGSEADALVVRFTAPINTYSYLRMDMAKLYFITEVGTTTKCLGEWSKREEDVNGYAYFTAVEYFDYDSWRNVTENAAPRVNGTNYTYFLKDCASFTAGKTVERVGYSEENIVKNSEGAAVGYYREGEKYIVVPNEDYSVQHDVELWVNETLYNATTKGIRAEDEHELILEYSLSGRKNFSFTDPKYFTWKSSDETIATVTKNEKTGAAQLTLLDGGVVTITLTVENGAKKDAYDLSFTFIVIAGKTPFMKIPDFSSERTTLTETDTDVFFSSNLTARNASYGVTETSFEAKLYAVGAVGDAPSGEPVWTNAFESTASNTLTHLTIPGTYLENAGIYAVTISASYVGGVKDGISTEAEEFSATAYLIVKQGALKVSLKKLESYSVDYTNLPTIEYTLNDQNANAEVEYTIQKSGEKVSERKVATGGVIDFTAQKPESLKDAYTITVYARNADAGEEWSVDSMLLRVYNMDVLDLIVKDALSGEIGGTTGGVGESSNGGTVTMDNHEKLSSYGIDGESYRLTVSDLNSLRYDISLQKIISVNYGSGVWGLLTDQIVWKSSDSSLVSLNFKQAGFYSDIRNYSYTSYSPTTDFLLAGKGDTDGVTITATHAATGKSVSLTVKAKTLENQLYLFQFFPKVETDVVYFTVGANGEEVKRTLKSDENGVLAVYEPTGIHSAVMAMATKDGETYVGAIYESELESGEKDIASLQLYPTNNLRLRSISSVELTFLTENGALYSGEVALRVGVYKNGVYCPDAKIFLPGDEEGRSGREDILIKAENGKVKLGFNPMTFKNNPDDAEETGAYPGDKISYVVEYRVQNTQTSYTILNVFTDAEGEQDPMDGVISLKSVKRGGSVPQIIHQTLRQYSGGKAAPFERDVINYTENIGISRKFDKAVLTTDFVLPESSLSVDEKGFTVLNGDFALYTASGRKITGQTDFGGYALSVDALSKMEGATLFVFPFSAAAYGRHTYTMTNENMTADGITDEGVNPTVSSRLKFMFVRENIAISSVTLPFGVSNLSHQKDLSEKDSGAEDIASGVKDTLGSQMSIGDIFNSIDVNSMIKKGFTFLGGLSSGNDSPISLMILPTEDPGVFRIIAFVGEQGDDDEDGDGVSVDYDTAKMYEDYNNLIEDDDDDDGGEGSYEVNFSGIIVLEAGYNFASEKWNIDFLGGNVGAAFSAKYEWGQNFLCGPIPTTVSFEVGAHAELEVSFANKNSVKQILVDATVGVSVEAFAGIGFDVSIAKLKLGIYGNIGADVNFLLLSDFNGAPPTGTKLTINGEIGIRLEVKILLIEYKKTFASTGFNWSKKWNSYDAIQQKWEDSGAAEIFGLTRSGRAYSMRLLKNGSALVTIEGDGEIEDRDYLELGTRAWNNGAFNRRTLLKNALRANNNGLANVQTNAYPYSNPVFVDDGSMFLYISDNDNGDELESVVSYAEYNGTGYDNKGALYSVSEEGAILADSDVVASGSGENLFAAWVKQHETVEKEMNDAASYDDLGMMLNATEIYVGTYNGKGWTSTRLTNNSVADMSPTVASFGERAIVAWRSLSATKMPENGGEQDISTMFNAENNLNYSIYDGATWSSAKIAYNGSAGTVNAIDSAMLKDGTSILVYTVRTGDEITTSETFFTLIDADGNVVTTGRLTNDAYTDVNAQVAAAGNDFVVGWYSEHESGEIRMNSSTGEEESVLAHDIRLARIHSNGSVDETFPESIGGDSASEITSSFKFSSPAENDDFTKLSLVWAQRKNSTESGESGKYEIYATRFYEIGGTVGTSAKLKICETENNFTVDHFDTYTDSEGRVHVIVLGSDYNSLEGLAEYDTIDLSDQPIETSSGSKLLTILEQDPIAYIKTGSAAFLNSAVEVTAESDLKELVPGLDLPVQFTIQNVGTSTVEKVDVQFGEKLNKSFENLSLLPNESVTLTILYPVPETSISDVEYTVTANTANGTAFVSGTMKLNRPDVGISSMKLVREENGEREIQIALANKTNIPLSGSGKTVKLAFYRDNSHDYQVGETLTIPSERYADIDSGIFVLNQTLKVSDFLVGTEEIPDSGLRVYAKAWIEEENVEKLTELYPRDNSSSVFFKGLLTRNDGKKVSVDTFIEVLESGYEVSVEIQNNSLQEVNTGIPVLLLLDENGDVIAQKTIQEQELILGSEERKELSVSFDAAEVKGTLYEATVRYIYTISFDAGDGSGEIPAVVTDLNGHAELPTEVPTAPESDEPLFFTGWFTALTGGEKVENGYTFNETLTLYAQYSAHRHEFTYSQENENTLCLTCVNEETDCTLTDRKTFITIHAPQRANKGMGNQNAILSGAELLDEQPEILYYTANADGSKGEPLSEAPAAVGKYWAEFSLSDGGDALTAHVVYAIPEVKISYATIPNFKKITSVEELNGFTKVSEIPVRLWVTRNAQTLDENTAKMKLFVVRTVEDSEDGVTKIYYSAMSGNTSSDILEGRYERYSIEQLSEMLSNETADVYILGAGGEQVPVSVEFQKIKNSEGLSGLLNCSEYDVLVWMMANKNALDGEFYQRGDDFAIVFELSENRLSDTYVERNYRYYNYGSYTHRESENADYPYFYYPIYIATGKIFDPNVKYTLTYDANGGTGTMESEVVYAGSEVYAPNGSALKKYGYSFVGWNTAADGSGTAYAAGEIVTVEADLTLYAEWQHVHNWSYSFDAATATYTATCQHPGCSLESQTLKIESGEYVYSGKNPSPYTVSENWTKENGFVFPTTTYYKDGEKVSEAKNVGTYAAQLRLKGVVSEEVAFTIVPRPIAVVVNDQTMIFDDEDPFFTVTYFGAGQRLLFDNDTTYPWKIVTEGDKVYAKSGNSYQRETSSTLTLKVTLEKAGTVSFDYKYGSEERWDCGYFRIDGNEKLKVSGIGDWQTFTCDIAAGTHTLTWAYSKDWGTHENGDFFAVDNISITSEGALTQEKAEGEADETVPFESLIEGLRFKNDGSYPWTEKTEGDKVYAKSGNGGRDNTTSTLTLTVTLTKKATFSFDYNYGSEYSDKSYFYLDGNEQLKVSGEGNGWQTASYELDAGEHVLTWKYEKDFSSSENGDFFAIDNLSFETEGKVKQESPRLALMNALLNFEGGIVEGDSLNYKATYGDVTGAGTYEITLELGENPNYDVREVASGTLTVLEAVGEKQTIEVSDITATYGDTGVKIVASLTTGDGTLSYAVKSGDAVLVDEEGNITILKAGTAEITVAAAKTENYLRTTAKITVTVNPKEMSVSANNVTETINGLPHGVKVTATDPAEGYTVKYGTEEGTYNLTESPTIWEEGTLTVYYQVTAENYLPYTGKVTLTLVTHQHEFTFVKGTGENENSIIATCSGEDCPLENRTAILSISAPTGEIIYDGKAHSAIITDENSIQGNAKVLYAAKENGAYGEESETAPINAGVYKASISLGEGENQVTVSVEYEILNAELTSVSVSQKGTLTYNATAQTPQVNASATAVNNQKVTFTYSLTEDGEYAEMPTFTLVADSGTVYFKATAENHNEASGNFTVTVVKASVSAPAAPTLSSATANRIVLAAVEGYEYSMDGATWQESATFNGLTKKTEYSFYQRLKETENTFASPASAAAKLSTSEHDHEWTNFTADGASISATCLNTDGGHSGELTATMTIVAPTRTVYGAGSAEATIENNLDGIDNPTIVYTQGETVLSSAPTNVGEYTASITLGEGETAVRASVTYTIAKAALTITANASTISYGDEPTDSGVTYSGFASGENASVLSGTLEFEYTYSQFGGVGTYTLTPKGLTSGNYEITFVSGNLKVNPKAITVTIQSATSVYGDEQATLTATTVAGAIVNGDEGIYTLACEVTNESGAGSYDILGTDTSENYAVTFVGGEKAYQVSAREIEIIWAHTNDLVYNKTAQKPTATATNLVNGDTVSLTVTGEEVNAGTNYTASAAFAATQANYILPEEVSTTFSIAEKPITVTIQRATSVYGEKQATLSATTQEGAIEEGDTGVYSLSSEVTSASGVGSYDILGTDASGNYLVTFEGEKNAYEVTARTISIIWAHTSDLVYNKTEQKPTAIAANLVNGDKVELTVTGEQVNAGEGYEASAAFAAAQANYILPEVVSTTFSIAEKPITVTIQSATSVYGDEQATLTATTAEGAIVNSDTGVYTLACEVTETSGVGSYDILGTDASDNYLVTFEGGEKAYQVTAREIEIVWTHTDDLAYNKKAQQPTATAINLVNGDEVSLTVTGEGTFVGEGYEASAAFTTEQANYILPEEVSTTFSILPKPITVTIEKKSSVYGEKQVELSATTEEGAIEEGDEEVYELTSEVNEKTPVGSYAIQGETLNENYEITFENAENGYQVTARVIGIVWSGTEGLVYNKTAQKPGATATNLVNGDRVSLTVTGEQVNAGEGYEARAAFATAQRNYALPSNASTTFSIAEKPITVTIQSATSVYKEAQATLSATTEEGAIEEGDELPYELSTQVNETTSVGFYDILGTDTSENYLVTFAGEKNAYEVTKRPIIATAEEKTVQCGDALPEYTFSVSEEIAEEDRNELKERTSFASAENTLLPGKYEITFSFADGYTGETALKNYSVTLENSTLYILTKALTDNTSEEPSAVEILLEDSEDAFDYNISVEIDVLSTTETESSEIDFEKVREEFVDRRSEISKVYSIKLYRTETVNGVETLTEIQPSDIEEGLKLVIKMEIPDYLTGRNFKILHIHSQDDIEYIAEENIEISDGYAFVTIDRLSDFAFVHLKDSEEINHKGFCLGWLGIVLDALVGALFAVAVIKREKKLLNLIGLGAAGAVTVFALVVLISHLCYASIVGLVLAVLLLIAFFTFFLLQRKGKNGKATEENK